MHVNGISELTGIDVHESRRGSENGLLLVGCKNHDTSAILLIEIVDGGRESVSLKTLLPSTMVAAPFELHAWVNEVGMLSGDRTTLLGLVLALTAVAGGARVARILLTLDGGDGLGLVRRR